MSFDRGARARTAIAENDDVGFLVPLRILREFNGLDARHRKRHRGGKRPAQNVSTLQIHFLSPPALRPKPLHDRPLCEALPRPVHLQSPAIPKLSPRSRLLREAAPFRLPLAHARNAPPVVLAHRLLRATRPAPRSREARTIRPRARKTPPARTSGGKLLDGTAAAAAPGDSGR